MIELYRDGLTLAGDGQSIFLNAFTLTPFLKKRQTHRCDFVEFICALFFIAPSVLHQKLCKINSNNQQEPHTHFVNFQPGAVLGHVNSGSGDRALLNWCEKSWGSQTGKTNKELVFFVSGRREAFVSQTVYIFLGGGFKYFLCSTLPVEMIHFD